MADTASLFKFSPIPVTELQYALDGCPYLRAEWSLKLTCDAVEERSKFICWINHHQQQASPWLENVLTLLQRQKQPWERLVEICFGGKLELSQIANLGIGLGGESGGESREESEYEDQPVYLHRVNEFANPVNDYLGFVAGKMRRYQFYAFSQNANTDTAEANTDANAIAPEEHVSPTLMPLFSALKRNATLQANGGFWLRTLENKVDQVSLSFIHRPFLADFIPALSHFSRADLQPWQDYCVKHIAFNAKGDLTLYFSGRIAQFSDDFQLVQRMAQSDALRTRRVLEKHLL